MSLINKPVTPEMVQANRANSLKSSGPKTAQGKAHSRVNSLTHGGFVGASSEYLRLLGEDPNAFTELRERLRETFLPEDAQEEILVDDMAELRWRLLRIRRAEAATFAKRRWQYEEIREGPRPPKFDLELAVAYASNHALLFNPESSEKYRTVLNTLVKFREAIRAKNFQEDVEGYLTSVYGKPPSSTGAELLKAYKSVRDAHAQEEGEEFHRRCQSLLQAIETEIPYFQECLARQMEIDTAFADFGRDAALLPLADDNSRFLRYEVQLERLYERKLQQFVSWQKAKGRPLPGGDMNPGDQVQPPATEASAAEGPELSKPIPDQGP